MAEQAESELESTGSQPAHVQHDSSPQIPAEVLHQFEALGDGNPVDRSFGERRSGLREKLTKLGLTIAALAGAGALILATHGAAIAPLKGWLAAHHFSFAHFFGAKHVPTPDSFGMSYGGMRLRK